MEGEKIETINYKQAMLEHFGYYKEFCVVFSLMNTRERIETLRDGIVIEIRNKEEGHNIPHIHAKYQGDNIVAASAA